MKLCLSIAVISFVFFSVNAMTSPPLVQVYTHLPADYGKVNTLICHVSGFQPPDITIELLEDDKVMENAQQTDLAFEDGWKFYLTKSVHFTPIKKKSYKCRVKHMTTTSVHLWDTDM